jgi:hypothetical protein
MGLGRLLGGEFGFFDGFDHGDAMLIDAGI